MKRLIQTEAHPQLLALLRRDIRVAFRLRQWTPWRRTNHQEEHNAQDKE